jgi:hypothetical protein
MQHDSPQSASSSDECGEILQTHPWCNVVRSAERITRPEWDDLFPRTEFYLVKYDLYGSGSVQRRNALVVEQDGWRYTTETFDKLLEANGITAITDENRELVAQAFALMTIPDYLGEEVVFTEWENIEGQPARHDYDHCLRAWTKLQGREVGWCFVFGEGRLKIATEPVGIQYGIGDYINVSPEQLTLPAQEDYRFTGG